MKRIGVTLALGWAAAALGAQSPGWEVLTRAAEADPAARQTRWAESEADGSLEAARRTWWPRLTLEAPALVSVSGNDQASSSATALSATVTQKLPGQGSVTAGYSQTLSRVMAPPAGAARDPVLAPTVTLAVAQPLGPGLVEAGRDLTDLVAQGARLQARLKAEKARRDLFTAVVQRASALDQAEAALVWRRAQAAAAQAQADLAASWASQGRATPSDRWKADRDLASALWAVDQAQRTRDSLAAAWERKAGFAAPSWSSPDLLALRQDLRSRAETDRDPEDDLADLAVDQARWALVTDRSASDPKLQLSTSAQRNGDQPWVFSAQAGVTVSTDLWLTVPVAQARGRDEVSRREDEARQGTRERQAQREERRADLARTEAYLVLLERQRTLLAQQVADTEGLVRTGQLTQADLATVRAEAAELALEWRKTLWDAILLLTPRSP